MKIALATFLSISLLVGCTSPQQQLELALSLDVDHFKRTMIIVDDEMEKSATFSTVNGFVEKRGLLGIVWSDSFLRGFLNKETGVKTYQCYVALRHTEGDWAFPYQANYGRPLRTVSVSKIHSDVDCSGSDLYGSCTYNEHVVFTIHPDEVARIIRDVTPEDLVTKVWRFRIKNQGIQDYDDGILLAEFIALIQTMDEYQIIPVQ